MATYDLTRYKLFRGSWKVAERKENLGISDVELTVATWKKEHGCTKDHKHTFPFEDCNGGLSYTKEIHEDRLRK